MMTKKTQQLEETAQNEFYINVCTSTHTLIMKAPKATKLTPSWSTSMRNTI